MYSYLVLFGSGQQASALSVQLRETPCDALHTSVKSAILIVLGVEVVLVALPLIHRHYCSVFTVVKDGQKHVRTQSVCDGEKLQTIKMLLIHIY